jgi:hypothetical protein
MAIVINKIPGLPSRVRAGLAILGVLLFTSLYQGYRKGGDRVNGRNGKAKRRRRLKVGPFEDAPGHCVQFAVR